MRLRSRRVLYTDSYGVHDAYSDEFEDLSRSDLRFLIKNATSKQQPVDQELGVFCQNFIKKRFYLVERDYNDQIRKGLNPPQRGLAEMRLWFMNVLKDLYYELKNNRQRLIRHSWQNTGLGLSFDGLEDEADEFSHF